MKGDAIALVAGLSGIVVALSTQIPSRAQFSAIKAADDTYKLPQPRHLRAMSLGYRSAIADLMWADVLVSQGLRLQERRRYNLIVSYIDGINELDPTWREPYRMADSLVTMQTERTPLEQIWGTRRILERGVRERPNDAELWMTLGSFVGYIAPGAYFEDDDPEEAQAWRQAGAEALARAATLAPSDADTVWQSLGAAKVFARVGQAERGIEMYKTILATTDDPELQATIEAKLRGLDRDRNEHQLSLANVARQARREKFVELWLDGYPGSTLSQAYLLGPPRMNDACVGGTGSVAADEPVCASTWAEWGARDPIAPGWPPRAIAPEPTQTPE